MSSYGHRTSYCPSAFQSSVYRASNDLYDYLYNIGRINHPSTFFILGDTFCDYRHAYGYGDQYCIPGIESTSAGETSAGSDTTTFYTFCHQGSCNFGFIDGHVEAVHSPEAALELHRDAYPTSEQSNRKFAAWQKDGSFKCFQ